jgi:hypothetical protein
MSDGDSKDNRSKAKEALLEWVRKKTSGYVISVLIEYLLMFFVFVNLYLDIQI